jgi:hypothetical protein
MPTCRRLKVDPYLSACTKLIQNEDFNVRSENLKLQDENRENASRYRDRQ